MASNDSDAVIDFSLVRTYLPGLFLVTRAILFFVLYFCLVLGMTVLHVRDAQQGLRGDLILLFLSATAYFDFHYFRHDALSRASGSLCPLLLVLLTCSDYLYPPTMPCIDMTSLVFYYTVSVAWAASSSFCVVNMLLRLQSFNINVAAILWGAAGLVLLYVDCRKKSLMELAARSLLYYVLTIVLWFSQTLQPDLDRNRFTFSVLHTCLHVLFVDVYVVIGSVCIWLCILVYHHKTGGRAGAPSKTPARKTMAPPPVQAENDIQLLRELEAAKRGVGLV